MIPLQAELLGMPIGSLADLATFVLVLFVVMYRLRPKLDDVSALVVALARRVEGVDEDEAQSKLDVEDRHVAAVEHDLASGGDGSP